MFSSIKLQSLYWAIISDFSSRYHVSVVLLFQMTFGHARLLAASNRISEQTTCSVTKTIKAGFIFTIKRHYVCVYQYVIRKSLPCFWMSAQFGELQSKGSNEETHWCNNKDFGCSWTPCSIQDHFQIEIIRLSQKISPHLKVLLKNHCRPSSRWFRILRLIKGKWGKSGWKTHSKMFFWPMDVG